MSGEKEFLDAKEKSLKLLEEAYEEDEVDDEIIQIIKLLNDSKEYYTSSSCSGRIVLLEIPMIGDKKEAKFLGKWHRKINSDEVKVTVQKAQNGLLWLLAQAPIIHIGAHTAEAADKLIKIAVSSGFKNSGIKGSGKKNIVEICSTERLDAPIGKNGFLFCNEEYLKLLVDISNNVMEKSDIKLKKFEKNLRNI